MMDTYWTQMAQKCVCVCVHVCVEKERQTDRKWERAGTSMSVVACGYKCWRKWNKNLTID
jgi:hypothetical protein